MPDYFLQPAPPAPTAEDDLTQYARTGDPAAFDRLVRRHLDMVYTFCRRELNRDGSLAEDATQAVFIVLSRKALAGAVPPANRLSGWLFITARYCCDNLRRSQARRAKHERKAARMRLETDKYAPADTETEYEVHQAMAKLRDSERQALLLRFFDKLSFREVGVAMNISEAAAKFRVNRALKRMNKFLTAKSATAMAGGALPLWLQSNATAAAPQGMFPSVAGAGISQATPAAVAAANATVTGMAVSAAVKVAAGIVGSIFVVGGLAVGVATILPTSGPSSSQPAAVQAPKQGVSLKLAATSATQPGGVAIDLSTPEACLRSYVNAMRGGDVAAMERCLQYPVNEQRPGEMRGAMLMEYGACRLATACEQQMGAGPALYRFPTLHGQFEALVDRALSKQPGPVVPNGDKAEVAMIDEGSELVSEDKVADIRWFGFWNKTVLHLVRVNNEWKLDTDATLQAMSAIRTKGLLNNAPFKPTLSNSEMADRILAAKPEVYRVLERAAADVQNGILTTQDEVNDRVHEDLAAIFEKQQMLIPRYILMPKTR